MPELPPLLIDLGDFAPDLGQLVSAERDSDSHLLLATNCWPLGAQGYVPSGDFAEAGFSSTPSGQPTGSAMFSKDFLYYGNTEGEIFEASFASLTLIQRHTLVSGGVDWTLTRFGDSMVATNFKDPVLVQTARATSFSNLINAGPVKATDAQDETKYDSSPTTEGSFAGGTGHAASDVITLTDSTTVTVDVVSGGVVTEFTVDSSTTVFTTAVSIKSGAVLAQTSTTGSGASFSLTLGADNLTPLLQAKYVTHFGNRIVLANLKTTGSTSLGAAGDFPYAVWVSGDQAANDFDVTNRALRSVFQSMSTKWGEITGVIEVSDYLLIFFERAVYRATFDGLLPFAFRPLPVVENVGTVHPRSVVALGNAGYFWGPSGPAVVSASGYSELGGDKVSFTLHWGDWPSALEINLDRSLDVADIIGSVSAGNNSILWRYPVADSQFEDAILSWNFITGRFGLPVLHEKVSGQSNKIRILEDRTDVFTETWSPGSSLVIGDYDTTGTALTLRKFSADIGGGELGSASHVGAARFQLTFREILKEEVTAPTALQLLATPRSGSVAQTLEDAQDETRYDNSPTTEGSFEGGIGHAVADVITLDDASTATVDAVFAGVVTQFTIDATASTAILGSMNQLSSTGSGTGFVLNPGPDNVKGIPGLSVIVSSKTDPAQAIAAADTVTFTSADSLMLRGWMALQADVGATVDSANAGRYHQFDVTVTPTGTWHAAEIQALQIRYITAGSY